MPGEGCLAEPAADPAAKAGNAGSGAIDAQPDPAGDQIVLPLHNGTDDFAVDTAEVSKVYDGHRIYSVPRAYQPASHDAAQDRYLSAIRPYSSRCSKRLTPSEVLRLIEACGLARDVPDRAV
ncbi:MAG: hypothetical protein R3D83_09345 [Caenibius sp.]